MAYPSSYVQLYTLFSEYVNISWKIYAFPTGIIFIDRLWMVWKKNIQNHYFESDLTTEF